MLNPARILCLFCLLSATLAFASPFYFSRGVSNRNLLKLDRPAPYKLPKVHATAANPDTIFVVAFRVEFKEDSASLTTGTGLFDSDTEYVASYKYDKQPHDLQYFSKHLEFLRNYYDQVSDGRLHIEYRIFPGLNQSVPRVPKEMRDYGATKLDRESFCDFGERNATARMAFIEDAVRAADASSSNPFLHSYDEKRTVYLLIHAGASAFADGGYNQALGEGAKTTPSDFYDFFVSQRDIQYFLHKDSLAVANGSRSVKELMMVSETGNQDSVNFGINGILVNQFARQLGVPDLYGVNSACEGISAVGSFDIMDFSGYSAAMGFVPVYPSAWVRAFLGWTKPVLCRPGLDSTYSVSAASGQTANNEILQVPLNENEYLLIENRQRNLPGRLDWFRRDTIPETNEIYSGAEILDSIAIPDNGRPDIVVNSKNFEAGLPGSGVLAWHVDESVIRNLYAYNAVNYDSLRRGVSLIEADGVQDIGAQFSNFLGTPVQDYGQPADFFPHRDVGSSTTVNSLTPIRTRDGGPARVRIENIQSAQAVAETLFSMGHGDKDPNRRVLNYRSESFSLDLRWSASLGNWPQWSDPLAAANHPAALDLVDSITGKEIVVTSTSGRVFAWTIQGDGLGSTVDSIPVKNARGDTLSWMERHSLLNLQDSLSSPAVLNDTLIVAGVRNLYRIIGGSALTVDSVSTGFRATAGPVIVKNEILLGGAQGKIRVLRNFSLAETLNTQVSSPVCALASADVDRNGKSEIIAGLENGIIVCFEDGTRKWSRTLDLASPRLAVGDLDRAQPVRLEIVVRGREGKVYCLDDSGVADQTFWPVTIQSNASSQPALADLDGDRYLDILLSGTNRVYALDRRGNALANWPLILDPRQSLGEAGAPSVADVDGNAKPDVVFGFGSRDTTYISRDTATNLVNIDSGYYSIGLISAADSRAGSIGIDPWPVSMALPSVSSILIDNLKEDSTLQMMALSSAGWCYAWDLSANAGNAASKVWNGGAGNLARNPVYDDSLMPAAPQTSTEAFGVSVFYCYPNPVVGTSVVSLRYQLSHAADAVELTLYDQNNHFLRTITGLTATESWNRYALSLQGYGSSVYRAKLVARRGGERKAKFCKIAVVR